MRSLNAQAGTRKNAAREHVERQLADNLYGIKVPHAWLRGPIPPREPEGRDAVSTKGDPQPRPSRNLEVRA
jgi:hypothetical protein